MYGILWNLKFKDNPHIHWTALLLLILNVYINSKTIESIIQI